MRILNLLVIALLAISLLGSEWGGFRPVENWLERLLAVSLTVALVPAIALFQTGIVLRRFRESRVSHQTFEATCRRMTVAHSFVWLLASAAIIWALRWQDVVRGAWGLGNWPLVDELTILLPAILGLVFSWMVFYEIQQEFNAGPNPAARVQTKPGDPADSVFNRLSGWIAPRWEFVALRFRVQLMVVFFPAAVLVLILDLNRIGFSETQLQQLAAATALVISLGWPLLILLLWNTQAISNPALARSLSELNNQHRLFVREFRRWETGQQLPNAAVVGLLPRFRFVFLSDVILDRFPSEEIAAITRHEAGHIRGNHAWWRIGFLLLPILVLACHHSWLVRSWVWPIEFQLGLRDWRIEVAPIWTGFFAAVMGFAWINNRWLSHRMEFEADLYAAGTLRWPYQGSSPIDSQQRDCSSYEAMQYSLLRLAAYAGDHWQRSTLFHPSLRQRLQLLDEIGLNRPQATEFQHNFVQRRRWLVTAWLTLALMGAAASMF